MKSKYVVWVSPDQSITIEADKHDFEFMVDPPQVIFVVGDNVVASFDVYKIIGFQKCQ